MISEWDIYWITRLDEIRGAAIVAAIVSFTSLPFLIMAVIVNGLSVARRLMKVLAVIGTLAGFAATFTPSTKDAVAIKVIPAIVNSETTHRVAHETVEAALRLIEMAGKEDKK